MTTAPAMLNDEILAALEERWRRLAPAMFGRMEPGLSDAEIDHAETPLGLVLPEEVRRVFRWHRSSGRASMAAYRTLVPLETCVQSTLNFRADDEDWRPSWVSFMDEKPYMALDCGGDPDQPVAVWHYDYAQLLPTRPAFESIGALFLFWIELIDKDVMVWERSHWELRKPVPPDIADVLGGVPSD